MIRLRFSKMHGLGNDFMVIDAVTQEVNLSSEQIAAFADRHTGIGFDQLLLVAAPTDHLARFKLADLYRRHLADPLAAERLYLEVRNSRVAPREEMFAGNMLIELYRETGRRDRQIVELARFAERWRGTAAGRSASQALKELKQDLPEG